MSKPEVEAIMGKPTTTGVRPDGTEAWVWVYVTPLRENTASFIFTDGKVSSVPGGMMTSHAEVNAQRLIGEQYWNDPVARRTFEDKRKKDLLLAKENERQSRLADYQAKHPQESTKILQAMAEGRFIAGMNREQIAAIMGNPASRTNTGNQLGELETWHYKSPTGTFEFFNGSLTTWSVEK